MEHSFGGNWTEKKLLCLKKYLGAYATIMNKQIFDFFYVDAFAGTGYCNPQCPNNNEDILFEFDEANEVKEYLEGSARIALQIRPEFSQYLFIEKCRNHFVELEKLKNEFSGISEKIQLVNDEANSFIRKFCEQTSWKRSRAVMFLDPYGMQVDWTTIQAIARTKAIDLWYLFPLGTGVNRLLKKSKKDIPESWRNKLTQTLGTSEWEN
ncbi:MAG: three-Cys-motif partner protein TcmP, partial [Chlorobiales bacterium]|nr:three-Cys-motif partner protein TcmP [Chlorobiales bacterium]